MLKVWPRFYRVSLWSVLLHVGISMLHNCWSYYGFIPEIQILYGGGGGVCGVAIYLYSFICYTVRPDERMVAWVVIL